MISGQQRNSIVEALGDDRTFAERLRDFRSLVAWLTTREIQRAKRVARRFVLLTAKRTGRRVTVQARRTIERGVDHPRLKPFVRVLSPLVLRSMRGSGGHPVGWLRSALLWPTLRALYLSQGAEAAAILGSSAETLISALSPAQRGHLMHTLEETGAVGEAAQLAEIGLTSNLDSPLLVSAKLRNSCSLGRWEDAATLFDHASGLLRQTRDVTLWREMIRFCCLTSRVDRGLDLVEVWGPMNSIPPSQTSTAAVLFSTACRWDLLLELLRDRVDQGFPVSQRLFLDAVGQAARATERYEDVARLLERSLSQERSRAASNTMTNLLVEAELFGDLGLKATVPARQTDIPTNADVIDRVAWWRTLLAEDTLQRPVPLAPCSPVEDVDGGFYLCTDRNYLIGACVAVWVLLRDNPELRTAWPVTVFCEPQALTLAEELLSRIAGASGSVVQVISTSELMKKAALHTKWGIFTAHGGLSEATYDRIFAARWLIEEHGSGRAVYLDADTLPGAGLRRLFAYDLGGRPLAARTDSNQPGVRQAAFRLGLEPEAYFNAGVMVMDLAHPILKEALDQAVAFAHNHHDRITYFDQCALNFAFSGLRVVLPDRFNDLIFPEIGTGSRLRTHNPLVRHFIGPPKPWDPAYPGDNNLAWLVEFASLKQALYPRQMRLLLTEALTGRTGMVA